MIQPLIFIGVGGFKEISGIIYEINQLKATYRIDGILDDDPCLASSIIDGVPVLGAGVQCGVGVTLASLAYLSYNVSVNYFSHIGHGAHVTDNCKLGVGVQVGAMSFLTNNVGDGEFWMGNPAICLKKILFLLNYI